MDIEDLVLATGNIYLQVLGYQVATADSNTKNLV
jgi:hypothetical protein